MVKNIILLTLFGVFCLLFYSSSGYSYYPPDPTIPGFYLGDADGDEYMTMLDIPALETQANVGLSLDFYTLQPNNDDQRWNTCDADGDGYCTVLDLPYLYRVASGGIIDQSPFSAWQISNYNLPLSDNSSGSWIPFQLSVKADTGAGWIGRPGMIVKVMIDPVGSTITGKLSGRNCTPDYFGNSDQGNWETPVNDQCAVGVSITDWVNLPAEGLTEDAADAYGLKIYANGGGTLHLKAEVAAIDSFLIPALSNDFYISFNSAYSINIDCSLPGPNPVNELSAMQCNVTSTGGGTPQKDTVNDTCGGLVSGSGPWTYNFTPTEAQGPGNCTAAVEVTEAPGIKDSDIVNINEVNVPPTDNAPASSSWNEGTAVSFYINPTDSDIPKQTLTCILVGTNCPDGNLTDCIWSGWTPTEAQGPMACDVFTKVFDGIAYSSQKKTHVVVNEINQDPYWNTIPSDISIIKGLSYDSPNGEARDDDLPAFSPIFPGYLYCSSLNNNCSFGITIEGNGNGKVDCRMIFSTGNGAETCSVDMKVTDGYGASISHRITINVLARDPIVWYVNDDASGANNGMSWADAFNKIQDGISAAACGDNVWVAEGTYAKLLNNNDPVLTLKNYVEIYGGFVGTESNLSERGDPSDYPTVLDGENTSYHVVYEVPYAFLDGFTITHGAAYGPDDLDKMGGGIINLGSSPTINNCILTENSAEYRGGSIYNEWPSSPTITNCTFERNTSSNFGGGIYNDFLTAPTITNCDFIGNHAFWGGGIYSDNSDISTITSCTFSENVAEMNGGAIYFSGSMPVIMTNCIFIANSTSNYGGGIYNGGSSPTITGCTFTENSAGMGGGIMNENSAPILTYCTFTKNLAVVAGGIGDWDNSSPIITDCIFISNWAEDSGGGIVNYDSSPTITNCEFKRNYTLYYGGGGILNRNYSSPTITNCKIMENYSGDKGGGIINQSMATPVVTNCTFSRNSANSVGGAIYNTSSSSPTVKNCILWADQALHGPEIYNDSSTPTVSYSDVQGGYSGTGNISADPKFINPMMANYHLQPTSSCINAGDPSPIYNDLDGSRNDIGVYGGNNATGFDSDYDGMEDWWEDLYGLNKNDPFDAALDPDGDSWNNLQEFEMGADPFASNLYYVDIDAPAGGNGQSWATAFNNIQNAVNSISGSAMFWVAEGTYTSGTTNPVLTMKDYTELYGGFAGTETQLSQRNITLHPTILDGQSVSYHVVVGSSFTQIDGFTIKGGNANGTSPDNIGGGMYNASKTSLLIANCTFFGNTTGSNGYGGGIYNNGSSPTITNCTFSGNSCAFYGGAIYNNISSPNITNCTFSGNSASYRGGGISNNYSSPTITNCVFSGNSAIYCGGISNYQSLPNIKNCILWNDLAASGTPEIYYNSYSTIIVTYSDIKMSPSSVYTGTGNINSNPLFLHVPIFWDMTTSSGGTDYIVVADADIYYVNDIIEILNDGVARTITSASGTTVYFSPALSSDSAAYWPIGNWGPGESDLTEDLHFLSGSPCIDSATSVGAPDDDLDGYPRPYPLFGNYDMGAYEWHP